MKQQLLTLLERGAYPMEVMGLLREFERSPEEVRSAYREILAETKKEIQEAQVKKGLRLLTALLAIAALAAGCRAQVPPATSHVVNLTWTAPAPAGSWAGCTTAAPCVTAIYRCTAAAATCADTTNVAWKEITTASTRPSGTAYTDSTASGLSAFYVVETVQGSSNSAPSNMIGPLVVPGVPIAPPLGPATVAENDPPSIPPSSELALARPIRLAVRLR